MDMQSSGTSCNLYLGVGAVVACWFSFADITGLTVTLCLVRDICLVVSFQRLVFLQYVGIVNAEVFRWD